MIDMKIRFNVGHRGINESWIYLPMAMFKEHDDQAKRNHCDQDCEKLNSRGGIGVDEALAILTDKPFKATDDTALGIAKLMYHYRVWCGIKDEQILGDKS